ncbi:MAG TPA: hypothetical protein VNU48_09655 [Burkholderiaceae bacterium]|nr:hypothetical protein [Burkholderiaceae bacterium]
MTDKHRHRHLNAPHGSAPNWVLTALGVCVVVAALLARSFI